jgi:hypothetical protein
VLSASGPLICFPVLWVVSLLALVRPAVAQENMVPLAPTVEVGATSGVLTTLPRVRLTPPVVQVQGIDVFRLSLDGKWDFLHRVPERFRGRASEFPEAAAVEIPGHFAMQGFEPMARKLGRSVAFTRSLDVPAAFAGRALMLRFGSVDGRLRLWVNDRPVGSSDSAFLPVEFDVTTHIKPGESNVITFTLELSELTSWYLRGMGGVGRSVELMALPPTHVSRLHVETRLGELQSPAEPHDTAIVSLELTHVGSEPSGPIGVRFAAVKAGGVRLDVSPEVVDLPTIAEGTSHAARIELRVRGAEHWNNEHPVMYTLECELLDADGTAAMRCERPFGFREITLEGGRLLVNGKPVKLFGANHHISARGFGHHPPGDLVRADVARLASINLNALRPWPTPFREFVDACNELGVFTTIEVPINLQLYAPGLRGDHGSNPALVEPYLDLAARVVETYRSDPSVLLWGLANESIYYDYFQQAARAIRQDDPTRPIFFGGDARMGVGIPGVQVNDEHYPRHGITSLDDLGNIEGEGWHFPADRPAISTEWCHTHVNNTPEIALDPGVDDYWGYFAKAHAEWTWRTSNFLGGFIFLALPYHEVESTKVWRALFDDDRRPLPYAWHVFKANSPVRLVPGSVEWAGKELCFTLENRFLFTDLSDVTIELDRDGRVEPIALVAAPGDRVRASAEVGDAQTLYLRVKHRGRVVAEEMLLDRTPDRVTLAGPSSLDAVAAGVTDEGLLIDTGRAQWCVSLKTGEVLWGAVDGRTLVTGGPAWVVRGSSHPVGEGRPAVMSNLLADWNAQRVEWELNEGRCVVTVAGASERADGSLTLVFAPGDRLEVSGELLWRWQTPRAIPLFEHGLAVSVAPEARELFWHRNALWTSYPPDHIGRARGVAFVQPADGQTGNWSQDLQGGVTRDFRSTRLDFVSGGLRDHTGWAVAAIASGRQHLRASPIDDDPSRGFTLQVHSFYSGGSEFHLTKSIRMDRADINAGDTLRADAVFSLTEAK